MNCEACHVELDAAGSFPGATVLCACGAVNQVPRAAPQFPTRASGLDDPYRAVEPVVVEARMIQCPFCGAPCPSDARACPHCDVELASVRCPHCFALHFTGSRFCARCGRELELEPLLDAQGGPCPRCDKPLALLHTDPQPGGADGLMHECVGCGGLFVSQRVLDAIVARESPSAGISTPTPRGVAPVAGSRAPDVVRYLRCPLCHGTMNRVNFGRRSGVIVDVCKTHGVWFDRGELTQVVEFVAKGGLRDPPASADPRLREEAAKLHLALVEEASHGARSLGALGDESWSGAHHATLLEILVELFR